MSANQNNETTERGQDDTGDYLEMTRRVERVTPPASQMRDPHMNSGSVEPPNRVQPVHPPHHQSIPSRPYPYYHSYSRPYGPPPSGPPAPYPPNHWPPRRDAYGPPPPEHQYHPYPHKSQQYYPPPPPLPQQRLSYAHLAPRPPHPQREQPAGMNDASNRWYPAPADPRQQAPRPSTEAALMDASNSRQSYPPKQSALADASNTAVDQHEDNIAVAALLDLTSKASMEENLGPKETKQMKSEEQTSNVKILMEATAVSRRTNRYVYPPSMMTPREQLEMSDRSRQIMSFPKISTKPCKCNKSQCLKLYCACFSNGNVCAPSCTCNSCANTAENATEHSARTVAIQNIINRNPNAFLPLSKKRTREGCNCPRSQCLLKYCECFAGGIFCSGGCRCKNCENHPEGHVAEFLKRQATDKNLNHKQFRNEMQAKRMVEEEIQAKSSIEDTTHVINSVASQT